MLLVLARRSDETASHFCAFARAEGVAAEFATPDELVLSLTNSRDAASKIALAPRAGAEPATGVFNRGFDLERGRGERRFRSSERLAALWSVLAEFPGPVVNRPSRQAIVPELDANSLAQHSAVAVAPRVLTTLRAVPGQANVHRLQDGRYEGFFADAAAFQRSVGTIYRYTYFDPAHAVHAILAGNKLIPTGGWEPHLAEPLERLRRAVLGKGVSFAYLVLQAGREPALVHASTFPVLRQYEAKERDVHLALLDYLLAQ